MSPKPTPTPRRGEHIYVSNGSSVVVFDLHAKGNVAPIRTISGANTLLNGTIDIAVDDDLQTYVLTAPNGGSGRANSVAVFGAGAAGDVAPIQSIVGPITGLNLSHAIATDASHNIYVANWGFESASVTVYAAGANGNVAPSRTISGGATGLNGPTDIAVDVSYRLYVYSYNNPATAVDEFAAGANGDVEPTHILDVPPYGQGGMTLDGSGNIYVESADYGSPSYPPALLVYPAGAHGSPPPTQNISGPNTRLTRSFRIAVDSSKNIYVDIGNAILVFAAGSTGDAAPIRTISGPKTMLTGASGIAIR
jgi:hypothetical protein